MHSRLPTSSPSLGTVGSAVSARTTIGLEAVDVERLRRVADFVDAMATGEALQALLPNASARAVESIARHCRFSHGGLLIFPDAIQAAVSDLRAHGLPVASLSPSRVIRDRLCERYRLEDSMLEIQIARVPLRGGADGARELEVFLVPTASASGSPSRLRQLDVPEVERTYEHELHFGFDVVDPHELVLGALRRALAGGCGMAADGGGFNAHEGSTVLYFRPAEAARPARSLRLELNAAGRFDRSLAAHRRVAPHRRRPPTTRTAPRFPPRTSRPPACA